MTYLSLEYKNKYCAITKRLVMILIILAIFVFSHSFAVTTVDVTNLTTDNSTRAHNCNDFSIRKNDTQFHWNECSICSSEYVAAGRPDDAASWVNSYLEIKTNKARQRILVLKGSYGDHVYINDYWTAGSANVCNNSNVHMFICNCGYADPRTEGRRAHNFGELRSAGLHTYTHVRRCSDCQYDNPAYSARCKDSAGRLISCTNCNTTCATCGQYYTKYHNLSSATVVSNNPSATAYHEAYCQFCNLPLGKVTSSSATISGTNQFTVNITFKLYVNGTSFSPWLWTPGGWCVSSTTENTATSTNSYSQTATFVVNPSYQMVYYGSVCNTIGTADSNIVLATSYRLYIDVTPPTMTYTQNIVSSHNTWSTNQNVTVSGTENYCGSVNIYLKDGNQVVYQGTASVNNRNYSLNFVPNISVGTTQKNYTLQVTDTMGNSTTRTISFVKYDRIPPKTDKRRTSGW